LLLLEVPVMSSKGKPPGKRKPTPKAKPAPKHDPTTRPRRAGAAAGGSRPQPQQRRRLSATERARRQRRQRLRATASILAAVLVVAVAVGLVVQRKQADAQALRTLGVQTFPNLGQRHLQSGQSFTGYNSTPPTSGPHDPAPAPCGVSSQSIPNTVQVHDLEHGVVTVQYRPTLDPTQIATLQQLGRSYPSHVIVAPYPGLPEPVAATAWTKLLALGHADVGKLRRFIGLFRQHGPEAGVSCPNNG